MRTRSYRGPTGDRERAVPAQYAVGTPKPVRDASARLAAALDERDRANAAARQADEDAERAPDLDAAADSAARRDGRELPEPTRPAKLRQAERAGREAKLAGEDAAAAEQELAAAVAAQRDRWAPKQTAGVAEARQRFEELVVQLEAQLDQLSGRTAVADALLRYGERLGNDKPARDFHKRRAIGIGAAAGEMVKPTPADLLAALRRVADQLADVETPAALAERESEAEQARKEHLGNTRAMRQLAQGVVVPWSE